jgi:hypothetical protein
METGKTGKYFKYAIGEIILVVIGILIALQVNNWNENRKLRNTQTKYLEQLEVDIDSMSFQYKGLVSYQKEKLTKARDAFNTLKSCKITAVQKNGLDELLLAFNEALVLFQIRDTYDEMLSANILASIEDTQFKSTISEFFAQREAMQIYINEFRQDLSLDYGVIKEHVAFGFDSTNQRTAAYNIAEICNNPDFMNAIVEVIKIRENFYQMVFILSQKLERMQGLLKIEKHENLN